MDFVGSGLALSQSGFDSSAGILGIGGAELWSVLTVETRDCGFLPDRRPKILFERHIFHRNTGGAYDDTAPDLSQTTPGGYGADGANQYDRLARAIALDRNAALQSASWGLGQVMGFNYAAAGSQDVESFVTAMVSSEDAQLAASATFMKSKGLDSALRDHRWADFARIYNGANYAANHYDQQLMKAFAAHSAGALPDLTVRKAQLYLGYLGFASGSVDGIPGRLTRSALADFQKSVNLPPTGDLSAETLSAIDQAIEQALAAQ